MGIEEMLRAPWILVSGVGRLCGQTRVCPAPQGAALPESPRQQEWGGHPLVP